MAEYDRFNSLVRFICKKRGDDPENRIVERIHDTFVSCSPDLPENLKHDIAYYFEGACRRVGAESPVPVLAAKLSEVLYLVEGEYDRVEETFTLEEWEYIKEIIADFALEIEQQQLTYIMRHIVSRGILDR